MTPQANSWIPKYAMKSKSSKSLLQTIYLGSVGAKEPKWRSFWEWTDDDQLSTTTQLSNTNANNNSVSSESSTDSSPTLICKNGTNNEQTNQNSNQVEDIIIII